MKYVVMWHTVFFAGVGWSPCLNKAKLYSSCQAAKDEMDELKLDLDYLNIVDEKEAAIREIMGS